MPTPLTPSIPTPDEPAGGNALFAAVVALLISVFFFWLPLIVLIFVLRGAP